MTGAKSQSIDQQLAGTAARSVVVGSEFPRTLLCSFGRVHACTPGRLYRTGDEVEKGFITDPSGDVDRDALILFSMSPGALGLGGVVLADGALWVDARA